jgi:hypothetical protein
MQTTTVSSLCLELAKQLHHSCWGIVVEEYLARDDISLAPLIPRKEILKSLIDRNLFFRPVRLRPSSLLIIVVLEHFS